MFLTCSCASKLVNIKYLFKIFCLFYLLNRRSGLIVKLSVSFSLSQELLLAMSEPMQEVEKKKVREKKKAKGELAFFSLRLRYAQSTYFFSW